MNQKIIISLLLGLALGGQHLNAQTTDSSDYERFSIHAQTTVINQTKLKFTAPYTGQNSLSTGEENQTSLTTTLYLGARLWKGSGLFLNPEIAGGSGLSSALGIGDATNGETFRIGDPAPKIYVARLFFRQLFAIGEESKNKKTRYFHHHSDFNQIAEDEPSNYLSFTIGKVGMADYFDDNAYSHDPRTQFMSWGLMDNGAWDYAANTRGYTPAIILEYVNPKFELRYGFGLLPQSANGNVMNWEISKSGSHNLELSLNHQLGGRKGAIRLLCYYNTTQMGNYNQSIQMNPLAPSVVATRQYGREKFGFGLNLEQELADNLGAFMRGSWNNGANETWAFTEIDHSLSGGISLHGNKWKRPGDQVGMAYVISGISGPHRDYLKAGGYGFMLGDGQLKYAPEQVSECYYSAEIKKESMYISGAWQMVYNPGYNHDRKGPVQVFSIRFHTRI